MTYLLEPGTEAPPLDLARLSADEPADDNTWYEADCQEEYHHASYDLPDEEERRVNERYIHVAPLCPLYRDVS